MNHPAQESPPSGRAAGLKLATRNFFYSNPTLKSCWSKGHQLRSQFRVFLAEVRSRVFDVWNGIDSSGYQRVDGLSIKGLHGPEATGYIPVDPEAFQERAILTGYRLQRICFRRFWLRKRTRRSYGNPLSLQESHWS